jgi:hypothetical protein
MTFDWLRQKGWEGSAPCGPFLVPARAVADREPLDALADGGHDSGRVGAEDAGEADVEVGAATPNLDVERAPDADRVDVDEDLAATGFRLRPVEVLEHLRTAELAHHHGLHDGQLYRAGRQFR